MSLARVWLAASMLIGVPAVCSADIIWRGDFETADFMQWVHSNGTTPNFSGMPTYCRPVDAGDGSCLELTTDVVRQGKYSAKFTVKNSANALGEPEDCGGMPDCTRRVVFLKSWYATETETGTALPYLSERWISVSIYLPDDWDNSSKGWGPNFLEIKPYINNSKVSDMFSISFKNGSWKIFHRWSDVQWVAEQLPWQQQMFYAGNYDGQPYPRKDYWPEGLGDFPDATASHAALKSVNKGGWTDWVARIRFDARGAADGGKGFLELWKREDAGPWIEVLDIRPRVISRGGMTFDRGIGYNEPPRPGGYDSFGDHGGFAVVAGMYMDKSNVWDLPDNRVVYIDNVNIGDEKASLSEMAGGGALDGPAPPMPPRVVSND